MQHICVWEGITAERLSCFYSFFLLSIFLVVYLYACVLLLFFSFILYYWLYVYTYITLWLFYALHLSFGSGGVTTCFNDLRPNLLRHRRGLLLTGKLTIEEDAISFLFITILPLYSLHVSAKRNIYQKVCSRPLLASVVSMQISISCLQKVH